MDRFVENDEVNIDRAGSVLVCQTDPPEGGFERVNDRLFQFTGLKLRIAVNRRVEIIRPWPSNRRTLPGHRTFFYDELISQQANRLPEIVDRVDV